MLGIPEFRYHPNPIATGNVKLSEAVCLCCERNRGYIYTASVYAKEELENAICPFCIADGSAAKKFDANFSDDFPLIRVGISEQIIDEVTKRTPGYTSWQQEEWLTCCQDACEFHGDASKTELQELDSENLERFLSEIQWSNSDWKSFVPHYEAGGNPAVYKFVCRHCQQPRYGMDFS